MRLSAGLAPARANKSRNTQAHAQFFSQCKRQLSLLSPAGANRSVAASATGGEKNEGQAPASSDMSLFTLKRKEEPFVQLDHHARRREKETQEIVEAAKRGGMGEEEVRENISILATLLPNLRPNLDKMRASDWAKVLSNLNAVAVMLVALKAHFPRAKIDKIVVFSPKLLLRQVSAVEADCVRVRQMLAAAEEEALAQGGPAAGALGCDEIIEAVPYLIDPEQLSTSLANLARWFPSQNPIDVLRTNPELLLNIGEADLEADPLYGWTST